jgi:hypothetical protein
MLDTVIVYGAEPWSLSPAPGGRNNAVMVSKSTLEAMALPSTDGNYFLRKDRIVGIFQFSPANPLSGFDIVANELKMEILEDSKTKQELMEVMDKMKENEKTVSRYIYREQEKRDKEEARQLAAKHAAEAMSGLGTRLSTIGRHISARTSLMFSGAIAPTSAQLLNGNAHAFNKQILPENLSLSASESISEVENIDAPFSATIPSRSNFDGPNCFPDADFLLPDADSVFLQPRPAGASSGIDLEYTLIGISI